MKAAEIIGAPRMPPSAPRHGAANEIEVNNADETADPIEASVPWCAVQRGVRRRRPARHQRPMLLNEA